MKTLKHPTLALIVLLLVGCSKESTTTQVKGFVADATNLNRLAGATVFLKKQNTSCFSCQGSTIDVTTADNNGNYSFDFEHEKGFTYSLTASHNNYWDILPGYFYIDKGEKNTKTLTMSPKAYLRVFIKNTSPYDGNDVIATGSFGGGGISFMEQQWTLLLLKQHLAIKK
jgi:hypothetical protein